MTRYFFLTLALLFVASTVYAGPSDPVYFADANLKSAVETELGIVNPTEADMLGLTYLDANSLAISDLTGLQFATNLKTLSVWNNNISNLGIISGLTNIKWLYVYDNPLSNLTPIQNMTGMLSLRAQNCSISDISVVANFTNLKTLRLNNNSISDANAISGLTALQYLNLNDNLIPDLNDVSALTALKYLYYSRNINLTDLSPLSNKTNLIELGLTDVNTVNVAPLVGLTQLEHLWLGYNFVTDINSLTSYNSLVRLNLSNNPLSYTARCVDLQRIEENNLINSFTSSPDTNGDIWYTDRTGVDLDIFVNNWLKDNSMWWNGYCNCADMDDSGNVNFADFAIFADEWIGL